MIIKNFDRIMKSIITTRKLFSTEGSEIKKYIYSIANFGRSGYEIEYKRFNENGDLEKHVIRDENELIQSFDPFVESDFDELDLFWAIMSRKNIVIEGKEIFKKNIIAYDDIGRISSLERMDRKGNVIQENHEYDKYDRLVKIKKIDERGDESVVKNFFDAKTGFWQATSTEYNGRLINYIFKNSSDEADIEKVIEMCFSDNDLIKRIDYAVDKLNFTFEKSEFGKEMILKKHAAYKLNEVYYFNKESIMERIDGALIPTEENIIDYEFF